MPNAVMPVVKQDIAVEIFIDGVWTNLILTDDVLADQTISIQRGDGDEGAAIRPCTITLRLNNDDDLFRISNPQSPFYGKAGVNTNIRVSVAGVARGIAEISSWKCGQSRDFKKTPRRGKAWTDIEAHGLLWRVNQWSNEIESTMVKGVRSFGTGLAGGWSLEDKADASVLSQILNDGTLANYRGTINLGSTERPAGCATTMQLTSDSLVAGTFNKTANSGWQISFAFKIPSLPVSGTYERIFYWYDSLGRLWSWEMNNSSYSWTCYSADGTLLGSTTAGFAGALPTSWTRFRMKVSVSGGTLTFEPAWYIEGGVSTFGTSSTFASSDTGYMTSWYIAALTYNSNANYASVFGLNNVVQTIFNSGVLADFNGRANERTGDRFIRLFADVGITAFVDGTTALGELMGGQPVDTLANLIKEIRDTDDGIVYDSKNAIRPVLALRNIRYNGVPITIDVTDENTGLVTLPEEVTDDLPIHNLVTVENRNGGSLTTEDSTSIMGTQYPPLGRGKYLQTITVNVYDPVQRLLQQANWWLKRGTVNLPRFPQLTLDLHTVNANRVAQLEAIGIGSVIEIVNFRENTIRLNVVGYTEVLGTHSRRITYTCAADQQFQAGVWNSLTSMWDLKTCTLNAAYDKIDTTMVFKVTSDETWSSTTPYDLLIGGERITVKTMAARAGTGPYTQTATVVRSVNGVVKKQLSGEPVHIFTPGRWVI